MGDMVLKKNRNPQWQSSEMLSRKNWYPIQQRPQHMPRPAFGYRPQEPTPVWRDVNHYGYSPMYHPGTLVQPNKGKEYYYLAPFYRNAMPPPPNPNRLLMVDPNKSRNVLTIPEPISCHCRSKSMEDVRSDVVEMQGWDEDENGNRVDKYGKKKMGKGYNRSMENLLLDTVPSAKRKGSYQVWLTSFSILRLISKPLKLNNGN